MTLDDAFNGLLAYWKLRPNGGTKQELLALAVQKGFEEPLLAEWLGVFLAAFVEDRRIAEPDYDTGLAPLVAEIGVDAAALAARRVYEYLLRDGRALYRITRLNFANDLSDEIAALDTAIAALTSARTAVQSNFTGANKIAATTAIDEALDRRTRLKNSYTTRVAELLAEA